MNSNDEEQDIWIWDIERQALQRITTDRAADFAPIWTLDGQHVVFASARTGVPNLYRQRSDGSGTDERLTMSSSIQLPMSFTPDGSALLFTEEMTTGGDVRRLRFEAGVPANAQTEPVISSRFREDGPEISPDGRWIAYHSNESGGGQNEVYVRPYPNVESGRFQISTTGGTRPVWSRDGKELFYLDASGAMMAAVVQTTPTFAASRPTKLFDALSSGAAGLRPYDVSRDGRFLMLKVSADAQTAAPATINVVLNWTEALKQLVK